MVFIGKLHEVSFYGLLTMIFCLFKGKMSWSVLWEAATKPSSFAMFFQCYLFWATVLFIPIAIIGAFATKYGDEGEGLTFKSDNIVVILFAHIAEELLGLLLTPFWFLKDLFTQNLDEEWKIFDYVSYVIELIFIGIGILVL